MDKGRKVVAGVQARMGSSRLPGKVLKPLAKRPVLWHILQRLERAKYLDEVVVATGEGRGDDEIAGFLEWLQPEGVRLFRGSEEDVLERFYLAVRRSHPDLVVRVTGDTPLLCTEHLDQMVKHVVETGCDGADAHHEATGLTLGFGSEVYSHQALVEAHLLAREPREREHVSLFIKERPELYDISYLQPEPELCSKYRLTLDTEEDYQRLDRLYRLFYRPGEVVDCRTVLTWLRKEEPGQPGRLGL